MTLDVYLTYLWSSSCAQFYFFYFFYFRISRFDFRLVWLGVLFFAQLDDNNNNNDTSIFNCQSRNWRPGIDMTQIYDAICKLAWQIEIQSADTAINRGREKDEECEGERERER